MQYKDYYKILEVDKSASQDEIKKSYRRLARKYHPDVNKDDPSAEKKFKDLQEANEVLGNAENRKLYDQVGANWKQYKNNGGSAQGFNWNDYAQGAGGGRRERAYSYSNRGADPFAGGGAGGFSDFFETIFGRGFTQDPHGAGATYRPGGTGRQSQQQSTAFRGKDVNAELDISFEEAYTGTEKSFSFQGERLKVKVPPGIKDGQKLKLKGKGQVNRRGSAGDLFITIKVKESNKFTVKGKDIYCDVPVDLYTAVLGGSMTVPKPGGSVKIKIPAETQSGKTFRLANLGMPEFNNESKRGNLYARVMIQIPEDITKKERNLFEKLADLRSS